MLTLTELLGTSARLPDVEAFVRYGDASVAWEKKDGLFRLEAVVPVGSVARVFLPGSKPDRVTVNGVAPDKAEAVWFAGEKNGCLCFDVGSGTYVFQARE